MSNQGRYRRYAKNLIIDAFSSPAGHSSEVISQGLSILHVNVDKDGVGVNWYTIDLADGSPLRTGYCENIVIAVDSLATLMEES